MLATLSTLPTPETRPGAAVVIFDGQCRFCRAIVDWLVRFDRGGRLAYRSLHEPEVARDYPDLTHEALLEEMVVVDPAGGRHHGPGAVRYLSRALPRLWWLAPLMHLPLSRSVWSWLYRQVAKRRYLLMGREAECSDGSCRLP